jgi:signal transduction histidine kinase
VLLFAPALLAVFRGGPRAVAVLVVGSLAVTIPATLHKTGWTSSRRLGPAARRPDLPPRALRRLPGRRPGLSRQRGCRPAGPSPSRRPRRPGRAQAANQAKSDFLATISHEIRTPLNSILGFAALVADDPTLSPENRRRLDLVGRAGRSLAEIVGDLLDFAKVEAGRLDLSLTPTSPAALLRDAVAIVAPEAAQAKGLPLSHPVETSGEGDDRPWRWTRPACARCC